MKLNHIGIAVNDLNTAIGMYRTLFDGLEVEYERVKEGAKMKMAMIKTENGILIELLEPLIEDGDIGRFIVKRGEGFHHIAYEVEDINAAYNSAKEMGFRILGDIERGAGGLKTFFIHPKDTHGVLSEFVSRIP